MHLLAYILWRDRGAVRPPFVEILGAGVEARVDGHGPVQPTRRAALLDVGQEFQRAHEYALLVRQRHRRVPLEEIHADVEIERPVGLGGDDAGVHPEIAVALVEDAEVAHEVHAQQITRQFSYSENDQIHCADFSPDGQWLAAGGSHHVAYIWHLAAPSPKHLLTGHQGWVRNVEFTPDGTLLATSSSDGTTRLWRTWTGTEQVAGRGYFLRFSHDGQRLGGLLGSGLAVFRVAGEAERRTFGSEISRTYEAIQAEISLDGTLVASANSNGIDVWQLDTGRHLVWLPMHATHWVRFRREANKNQLLIGTAEGVHSRTVDFDPANARLQDRRSAAN